MDKLLPTTIIRNYNNEQFASNAKDNEYWVPYCEKAYAKEADSNYRYYLGIPVPKTLDGIGSFTLTKLCVPTKVDLAKNP